MTISTKAELRTALGGADGLLHRTYTDAKLDEFILMGESRLNRELRLLDMIATQTGTLSTAAATLALPARYLEKIQFRLTDPLCDLIWVTPANIREYVSEESQARQPLRYTVTDTIEFDCVPDAEYSYTLKYYRGYQLSADSDTNFLLTYYPQAYLYASAIDAAVYARDNEFASTMAGMLKAELASIRKAERSRKGAIAILETDFSRPTYNINQG
jgi:hypothetical protein